LKNQQTDKKRVKKGSLSMPGTAKHPRCFKNIKMDLLPVAYLGQ